MGDFIRYVKGCKTWGAFHREEEGAGERSIAVGKGDKHIVASRPNMKHIRLKLETTVLISRDS